MIHISLWAPLYPVQSISTVCHGIRHLLILASVHVGAQELGKALVDAAFFGLLRGMNLRNLQLKVWARLNKYRRNYFSRHINAQSPTASCIFFQSKLIQWRLSWLMWFLLIITSRTHYHHPHNPWCSDDSDTHIVMPLWILPFGNARF